MIGSTVGPYRIESELGAGGMGSVYLAEVTQDAPGSRRGTKVALKIVHPHLLATPGFFKRFLREAELGRQVKHENVVRTFDVDATLVEDKQVNYMAMEYVEGRSLRQLLVDLSVVPEALLHEIASQAAAGLAAIHGCDIVHRDLKPENMLITNDQRVRIMDLGVAKLQEASFALTKEGQFAGSILYAAPEQFNNREVGSKSDLYSLGVMLYELGTGTNPFRREDAAAVIAAHLNQVPARASEINPDLSAFFSEVLAALLAKDPAERIESAAFLQDLLDQGDRSAWWAEREQVLRKHEQALPKIRVRRETELHGREAELAQLARAWKSAQEGRGNTVLIDGEPGIGKTRLVDAFLRTLGEGDVHLLYGSYPPSGGMGGISDAIVEKFGTAGLENSLRPYMAETPSLVPAFAALAKHESPPSGSEPLQGDALHAVCCNLARSLAEERPTIWIVDELHFAPAESRNLVLSLARAVEEHRILLIVTSRPGLPEDDLAHLHSLENFRRITLARLSPRGIIELVRDALQSEVLANSLGAQIAYKSDGVPLFAFEIIRGLKESGFLELQEDGSYAQSRPIEEITVPSAIKDLVEARLRDLSQEERAILDVGAVLGFEFDPDLVARVREAKRVQVLETLAAIERRTGVVRAKGRTYGFDHQQVQEVLHSALSEVLCEEYHTLLAEAFAEREGFDVDDPPEGEDAVFLAWHSLHGSEPRAGLPYLLTALEYLGQAYRTDTALTLADKALGAKRLLKGAERIEVLLRQASQLNHLGRREAESDALGEAARLAEQSGDLRDRSRVRRAQGWLTHVLGKNDEALPILSEAGMLAQEGGFRQEEAATAGALGVVYSLTGKHEEALVQFERHKVVARELGDRHGETTATGRVGAMHFVVGNVGEAIEWTERSLALSREVDRERHGIDTMNLAEMMNLVGQSDRAATLLGEARLLFHSIGSRRYEAMVLDNQGRLRQRAGEADAAGRLFREAMQLHEQVGDLRGQGNSHIHQGRLCLELGDKKEGARALGEARAIAARIGAPELGASAAALLATLPGGDVGDARRAMREHGARLEYPDEMEAFFTLWRAGGDTADLTKAQEMLRYVHEQTPEEFRGSLIENVPLHKAIMQAWEAHQK